jgi:rhamnosyltransferase
VERVYLVDNGSGAPVLARLGELAEGRNIQVVPFPENRGIAAAHNAGLRLASDAGAHHVLLLDQDSVPAADLVSSLLAARARIVGSGARVAAVGSSWFDDRSGRRGMFYRIRGGRIVGIPAPDGPQAVEVDFLISSGTLLYLPAVQEVGWMREDLFIDHVDTEWCLRAKVAGWRLFGAGGARIEHALGDDKKRVWLGRWREVALHSPDRNYYEVRNTLLLLRTRGIPWSWRLAQWTRLAQLLGFYALIAPDRGQRLRRMSRGVRDGLAGRAGPLT